MDEKDVSLLARKFNNFLLRFKRNKGKNFSRPRSKEDGDKGNNEVICYECKNSGHI